MVRYASAVECKTNFVCQPKILGAPYGRDIIASVVTLFRVGILNNLCYDCSVNLHKNNMGVLCVNDVISFGGLLRNV